MTEEEFNKLPSCIRYKNPSRDCRRLNSDDWEGDCCSCCCGFKIFERGYWPGFMRMSYEEVINSME